MSSPGKALGQGAVRSVSRRTGRFVVPGVFACALSLTALVLPSDAQAVSAVGSSHAVKVVDVSGVGLSGVSCNSKKFCVAVGSESNQAAVLPITHGVPGTAEIVKKLQSQSFLWAVNCPNSTYCLAAGQAPYTNPAGQKQTAGILVEITSGTPQGGITYVPGMGQVGTPDFVYLYGVGCTSGSEDCMAAGEDALDGGVVIPLGPGQSGLEQSVDPYRMNGASCFYDDYCIASGATDTETGVSGLAVGEKIGTDKINMEWGGSGIGSLSGASCHSDNSYSCVAVGSSSNGKKGVVLPIVNRTSGTTENVPGVTGLNGVACEGTTYCVAVGQNSSGEGVLVGITGSSVGTTVPVLGTSQLSGVGCTSNMSCIAVGADGSNEAVLVEFSLPLR
jgi:hypothetical protein